MIHMKKLAVNPYLPFWETVPDGEPHVFDGRVYVYGSHDALKGEAFCVGDYVGWSAPVDDLSDWRYEGVIYRRDQDPINGGSYDKPLPNYKMGEGRPEEHNLYAPDVAQGPDGRYYLFYALSGANVLSVAVCDTPAGQYEFLDYVLLPDGSVPKQGMMFDPGILCEESGNYLYYGFCPPVAFAPGMEKLNTDGAFLVKLADDMHTIVEGPKLVANGCQTAKGTSYEAHPFFEASSIRKFGDLYYFVYSSLQGNELCYGTAKTPDGPFDFGGVIISNGDMGYQGNTLPTNYMGNNHGGLVEINGQLYIFWHRQTHGTMYSRQGCADKVEILPDGSIPQVEITSCGLNNGPLPAKNRYESYIACHLTGPDRTKVGGVIMARPGQSLPPLPAEMPYITEEDCPSGEKGLKPYVYNLSTGCLVGFKYLAFDGSEQSLTLELRGKGTIKALLDSPEGREIGRISCDSKTWAQASCPIANISGTHALYFAVEDGKLDFASFTIA